MSVLVVAPEVVTSAAADLDTIASAVNAAHDAAAVRTTGFAAAAADEVSAAMASLFAKFGQEFQVLGARASAFHQQFVQALSSGSRAYSAAEAAGASLLQTVQHDLLAAVNAPTEAFFGRALIGTGAIGTAATPSGGIAGAAGVAGAGGAGAVSTVVDGVKQFLSVQRLAIYDLSTPRGWAALLLDYTWGLPGTTLGYGLQIVNSFVPNNGYDPVLSKQVGFITYHNGVGLPGYTTTLGNVNTSLGYGPGAVDILENHEAVHVWQSRLFGPLFTASYFGWLVGGGLVGTGYWLFHPNQDFLSVITTTAYYDNPWEVWAYTNDNNWPPPGALPGLHW